MKSLPKDWTESVGSSFWDPCEAPSAGPDYTGLALWAAGTLAGLATAALLAQGPLFRALARSVGLGRGAKSRPHDAVPPPPPPSPQAALALLSEAVVGSSRRAIANVFGLPRTAIAVNPNTPLPTIWEAQTWYYPLPKQDHVALAIDFADDLARRVQFLKRPGGTAM